MIAIVFIRSLIFNILFYIVLLTMFLISIPIMPFVPNKVVDIFWNYMGIPFMRFLLYIICGTKFVIRGKENILRGQGAIYASKHQSAVETYFLTSYIKGGSTYIFKKELNYIPIFGWAAYLYGAVPVDRKGGSSAMRNMLAHAKKFLEKGRSIIIFPEGTRTIPGQIVDYKPGSAFLYQNLNVPVVPVALNTGSFWAKHSFLRYPGTVIVEFMKPIEKNLDKREFIDKLKEAIETKCAEINTETAKNNKRVAKMLEEAQNRKG